jgi:DNA (cytosine-5)-methyltransferase 1
MRICNLYSGLGGNRKLWGDKHNITAVEIDPEIAAIYKDFYPNDTVIVGDAHDYLLKHYKDFDFIWSSPPCPSHSDIRRCGVHKGQYDAIYPDMTLYQEIILLQHFHKKDSFYCVENVKPYYDLLIPGQEIERHIFWTNFYINTKNLKDDRIHTEITGNNPVYGFDLKDYKIDNKRKLLRNLVNPELGLYIFNAAFKNIQLKLLED